MLRRIATRFYKTKEISFQKFLVARSFSNRLWNLSSENQRNQPICDALSTIYRPLSPIIGSNMALRYARNARLLPFVTLLPYRGFEILPVSYPGHLNHPLGKMPVRPFVLSDLDSSNKERLDPAKKFHRSSRGWFGPTVAVKLP